MSAGIVIIFLLFKRHSKTNALLLLNLAVFAITSLLLGSLVMKRK